MMFVRFFRIAVTVFLALFSASMAQATGPITLCEGVWVDASRDRPVPVRIRMPAGVEKVGVILFSHGLGGSLDAGTIWANAWAEAGYAVINIQHRGSDSAIFGKPGFRAALGSQQLIARARDMRFVIREIGIRQEEGICDLRRIDQRRIGIAGHSFGAQTVQAVSGQIFPFPIQPPLVDLKVRAAIGLSPSPPLIGSPQIAFSRIHIPFLSITGTQDAVPFVIPITPEQRQEPFRLMPAGDKFLLVLKGATHEMFAGQTFASMLNGEPPAHIRNTVIATTVAFWRATLDDDVRAIEWLHGADGLRAGLKDGDFFESR